MELMKLSNPRLVNMLSLLIVFICRVSSCESHIIPRALSIGMPFKSKLTTFGDLSGGVNVFKICLLFDNHLVSLLNTFYQIAQQHQRLP